jgi:hypothetical protein
MIADLWVRFHDNPRLRSIDPGSLGSLSAYYIGGPIKFLGVLPEIPDVPVPVLGEIVKRILTQDGALKYPVVNDPGKAHSKA